MKTVTDDFLEVQSRPDMKVVRTVEYKRRYWDPATKTYLWETSWTELPKKYLSVISPITWQLDTEILNEFKVSNVTLTLDNSFGYFNFDNPYGLFGQDDDSPHFVYEPYFTKFRIKAGMILLDGTEETLTMFTGVLTTDPIYDSDQKNVQFTIQGLEATLLNKKAEDIATTVTQENAGTGDGSTTEFTTDNPGVGGVTLVSVAGLTQIEGDDYDVSQLNDATLGAKVTFTDAPDMGDVVKISYFYWPQGLQFHELVEALLDAGDVASVDQDVEPVVFGNSVLNTQSYTSESDWNTGTIVGFESSSSPGSLYPNWDSSSFRESQTWSTSTSGWTGSGFTSDGTYIRAGTSAARIYRSSTPAQGVWEFVYRDTATGSPNQTHVTKFVFICTSIDAGNIQRFTGYALRLITNNGASPDEIRLHRKDSLLDGSDGTDLGSSNIADSTAEHTIKIVRDADGHIAVYYDGTLAISADDDTHTSSTYYVIINTIASSGASGIETRAIVTPPTTTTVSWESPAIDMTAAPTAWSPMVNDFTEDGTDLTVQTKTSTDNVTYESYIALSGSDIPQSGLKRYAKIKISGTMDNTTIGSNPFVQSLVLKWITSSSTITLPAFTGLNIYEAIQKIGEFTNYEFGFGPDEVFFFRPRSSGSAVMDLTESTFNSKITGFTTGYSRTYGTVRATYGEIVREITDTGDFPSSIKARIDDKRFEISPDSNIQIPPTADIATGVAQELFKYFSKPKKRFKLMTKFLPQLDLSDAVSVRFITNTPNKKWWLGDNAIDLGDKTVFLWGEKDQLCFDMVAKIIGVRYDTERHNCEFDMEEVL